VKIYGAGVRTELELHAFLTSALAGGVRSATAGEVSSKERTISFLCRKSNQDSPAALSVA